MIRLKKKYEGKKALFISGGPSILENNYDLSSIDSNQYTIFIETKALTPKFLELGLEPDYYFMGFPEKSKDNNLQHFIYRSFMAGSKIRPLLKSEYQGVYDEMHSNFEKYFETWKPEKGPQKKYKWKNNVFMKDSPYDLLKRLPKAKVITRQDLMDKYITHFQYGNPIHTYDVCNEPGEFDLEQYYNPIEYKGSVRLHYNTFLNSAAIAIYPLLNYMGFKKVFFLGMDMSNVGSLEYAAPYIFKSMHHFKWYFYRTKRSFCAEYIANRPFYFRPHSEFADLNEVFNYDKIELIRIYDEYKYAAPVEGIRNIPFNQFVEYQS
jgi:hypothetical protein